MTRIKIVFMNNGEILSKCLALLNTPELAELGPERRDGIESAERLRSFADSELRELPQTNQQLILGTLLLWHDYLDESHAIAQDISNSSGSLLHALMHRREPDYFNAGYWFRRVGNHPAYGLVGDKLRKSDLGSGVVGRKLLKGNNYDPFAMLELCEKAHGAGVKGDIAGLQAVQKMEFEALMESLL